MSPVVEPKAPAAGSAPRVVGATVAGCQCELLPGHGPVVEDLRSMMSSLEAKRVLSVGEGGEGSTKRHYWLLEGRGTTATKL